MTSGSKPGAPWPGSARPRPTSSSSPRRTTRPGPRCRSRGSRRAAPLPRAWLRGHGLDVADSDANFVLFGGLGDRRAVWRGLLGAGVLVREAGPPGWLRVTIGTPAEMAAFRSALTGVLTAGGER